MKNKNQKINTKLEEKSVKNSKKFFGKMQKIWKIIEKEKDLWKKF